MVQEILSNAFFSYNKQKRWKLKYVQQMEYVCLSPTPPPLVQPPKS